LFPDKSRGKNENYSCVILIYDNIILQTDCFLLCYSVGSRSSFENIASKWHPEIQHHCPKIPVILIGKARWRIGLYFTVFVRMLVYCVLWISNCIYLFLYTTEHWSKCYWTDKKQIFRHFFFWFPYVRYYYIISILILLHNYVLMFVII